MTSEDNNPIDIQKWCDDLTGKAQHTSGTTQELYAETIISTQISTPRFSTQDRCTWKVYLLKRFQSVPIRLRQFFLNIYNPTWCHNSIHHNIDEDKVYVYGSVHRW